MHNFTYFFYHLISSNVRCFQKVNVGSTTIFNENEIKVDLSKLYNKRTIKKNWELSYIQSYWI